MITEQDILNANILVVDDNKTNVELLEKMLASAGYTSVLGVTDPREAVDIYRGFHPDLVLLDINMPHMDGYQVMEELKKIGGGDYLPILVLTAQQDHETRLRSLKSGAKDFLSKPFDQAEALTRIRNMLEVRLLHNRVRDQNNNLIREITERKKMEEALVKAKNQAEEATKLKDRFVSMVAHDLRAPFTGIIGYMELLLQDTRSPLTETQKNLVSRSLDGSNYMLKMLEQLLQIGRFQTGQIKPVLKFCDAQKLAMIAILKLKYVAERKGVRLVNDLPTGTRVFADPNLFLEVLLNLVSNAVKFCGEKDTVTLFAPEGQKVAIAVKDTGVGIPEKILPDIFRHEVKTSLPGTAGEKGTGLGLPFCRDIIQSHGGEITVESAPGKGAVFVIRLKDVRPRVLVVEDSRIVLKEIMTFLAPLNAELIGAGSGEEAFKILCSGEEPPHLIISDLLMEGMDGFELLNRVKSDEKLKIVPFLAVTGDTNPESRERAMELGASDFLEKPIKDRELVVRVGKLLDGLSVLF